MIVATYEVRKFKAQPGGTMGEPNGASFLGFELFDHLSTAMGRVAEATVERGVGRVELLEYENGAFRGRKIWGTRNA